MSAARVRATLDSLKNWIIDSTGAEREEYGYKGCKTIDHVEAGPYIHHTENITFKLNKRYAIITIHDIIEQIVERSSVSDGFIYIANQQLTASILITEAEPPLLLDIARKMTDLTPHSDVSEYEWNKAEESGMNADAFIKSLLWNSQAQLPITKGKLDVGPWLKVILADYDAERLKVTGLAIKSAAVEKKSAK